MLSSNYSNRLFGRTRGRSKKKFDLKKYHQSVSDKKKSRSYIFTTKGSTNCVLACLQHAVVYFIYLKRDLYI